MMEILQVVANKLKCDFCDIIKNNLIEQNYGIASCIGKPMKSFNSLKLEIIFINNLYYIPLNLNQLRKIKSGNYKNLFTRESSGADKLKDINLKDSVIVNNTYITNINNVTVEDTWDQTDF